MPRTATGRLNIWDLSVSENRTGDGTDEGIRLVRGWLGERLARGAVARCGTCILQTWRDDSDGRQYAFIPISAGVEHPTLESVNRLTHEHELKSYLDSAWALRPLELVRERGQTMLVVDYTGGEPLDHLVREPMEIGQFLRLSVALSGALGQLHGRGLIHKDIKPANCAGGLRNWTGPPHRLRHRITAPA